MPKPRPYIPCIILLLFMDIATSIHHEAAAHVLYRKRQEHHGRHFEAQLEPLHRPPRIEVAWLHFPTFPLPYTALAVSPGGSEQSISLAAELLSHRTS